MSINLLPLGKPMGKGSSLTRMLISLIKQVQNTQVGNDQVYSAGLGKVMINSLYAPTSVSSFKVPP
ncbi:hypothetical protein LYNGBM3L_37180 [Moorena producens 3L]|uniref:Uncharacterized protein n=1 Tax=Moorena producens 3L TaxID=489825 RepID=F4XPW0_9CYAN|nr:hypothetical protein LYNGBM3L_37180 [Moorena producens 3L]OLT68810.1 hypothetical protein BI334_30775 [Moorena producens 3L]